MDFISELNDELEHQASMEDQEAFVSVQALRTFIEDKQPERWFKVTVDLCVYDVEEFDNRWRVKWIDKKAKDVFEKAKEKLDRLDEQRKKRFLFILTVWKNKRKLDIPSSDKKFCEVGHVYRVDNVYYLKIYAHAAEGCRSAEGLIKEEATQPNTTNTPVKRVKPNTRR